MFTPKQYAIYVLDDYSVHLLQEVKEALMKRGYVYVGIGGGITGDIQVNIILIFLLDPLFPLPEGVGVVWYDWVCLCKSPGKNPDLFE